MHYNESMLTEPETQRITRLSPVSEVLSRIDALVAPVPPHVAELPHAVGCVLAEDVVAPAGRPGAACALRDGFAVLAEATADAGSYAPMPLVLALRVDVGEPLPAGTNAVAPMDSIAVRDDHYAALAPVAADEGVLAIDGDLRTGTILRRVGQRLRSVDRAILAVAGIKTASVRRPRIRLVRARVGHDAVLEPAYVLLARAISAAGGMVQEMGLQPGYAEDLSVALGAATADAVVVLGGTGSGRSDVGVRTLAGLGHVEMHGIALSPGETAAFGFVGARPVLLVPGRLDAALAVWLVIGQRLLARLSACNVERPAPTARLTRKVASPLGITEVVPVRLHDGAADPLASSYWPLAAIAAADGWILVLPDSEGYPAGSEVVVRPWP
jgi:molybdopterin molybdotransferase